MADKKSQANDEMNLAKKVRLRNAGMQVDALNDELVQQISQLDDDELAVLSSIKGKLNQGLSDDLALAADTVGGFVW